MFFCYEDYQISKPILMLEALTLPRKRKSVKRVICLFQQKGIRGILFFVFLHLKILCSRSFKYFLTVKL